MNIYTSYFSKIKNLPKDFIPVSISLYPPKGWAGYCYKKLSPSFNILNEYKIKNDKDLYINRFNSEILSKLNIDEVLKELSNFGENIVLVCYEKSENFCHRHLVANWIGNVKEMTYED